MNFLNLNQYSVVFSHRCTYDCSYCCTKSSSAGEASAVEKNTQALINLLGTCAPGVILVSGGEPMLWKDMPRLLEALPQHRWAILSNLEGLARWIEHPNVVLVLAAYHEEFARPEKFKNNLRRVTGAGKRVHAKLIVKPGREWDQVPLWEDWNAAGLITSFTPLEYTFYFDRRFLVDLLAKYRTSALYNARFFRNDLKKAPAVPCGAGTQDFFQINHEGSLSRCSAFTGTDIVKGSSLFAPKFNDRPQACHFWPICYCEWQHWGDKAPANDNAVWNRFVETGVWEKPSLEYVRRFVGAMGWSCAGRTTQHGLDSVFDDAEELCASTAGGNPL